MIYLLQKYFNNLIRPQTELPMKIHRFLQEILQSAIIKSVMDLLS